MSRVSLVLICLSTVCSADLFTDDGIHITRDGSSRIIESVWTAVVVINPPPMIPMQAWVEEVRSGIQTVGSRTTAEDQKIWETRLEALLSFGPKAGGAVSSRPMRSLERRRRRVKRGLVDIIGEAGKAPFGIATQRDMTDIRCAVKAATKNTGMTDHQSDTKIRSWKSWRHSATAATPAGAPDTAVWVRCEPFMVGLTSGPSDCGSVGG